MNSTSRSIHPSKRIKLGKPRTRDEQLRAHVTHGCLPRSAAQAKKLRDTSLNARIVSALPNLKKVRPHEILEVNKPPKIKFRKRRGYSSKSKHIRKPYILGKIITTPQTREEAVTKLAAKMDDLAEHSEALDRFVPGYTKDRHGGSFTYVTPIELRDGNSVRLPANLYQPALTRNHLPDKFTQKQQAFEYVNTKAAINSFKQMARLKFSSKKQYDSNLKAFMDFLRGYPKFSKVKTIEQLADAIFSCPRLIAQFFRRYIPYRYITGIAAATIAVDMSAFQNIWRGIHSVSIYEYVPDLTEIAKAGKKAYGTIPKGADIMHPKEIKSFFDHEEIRHLSLKGEEWRKNKIYLHSWKLAYAFALRPQELYRLKLSDIEMVNEITELGEREPAVKLLLVDAKTVKNKYQHEVATRPHHFLGINIPQVLSQIKSLRSTESPNLLAHRKKAMRYDTGRNAYNKAIKRWVEANPEYKEKHYTMYTLRSSALCNACKLDSEKLAAIKNLARHTQG